jgi:thioredoxin-dependent peroxiredoxin
MLIAISDFSSGPAKERNNIFGLTLLNDKLCNMKRNLLFSILILASTAMYSQKVLSVGDKVPLFKATADDGSTWDMSKFIGKDYIVIYFFPGAMTSGCTKQACSYRDHQTDLASAHATVVGISGDSPENLKLFRQADSLNFTLLSDSKGTIAKSFGVPAGEGASIKRTVGGIEHELIRDISIKRWTFIAGKDGKIIYKNEAVDPVKDSEEVLKFLSMQK